MNEDRKKEITELVENAKIAFISSVDVGGYPNTKAMQALERDDIGTHYFSTNYSAKRTHRFLENTKACVYFCDETQFKGLMLIGDIEVCKDKEHRSRLWRDGFEMYYPKGIDDEDYCVLKFVAAKGNYYHGLHNDTFSMKEF